VTTELHSRREQAQEDLGLNNSKEQESIDKALEKEQQRQQAKEERRYEIEQSGSYMAVKKISKVMDDWYLDGVIGLVPVIGDILPMILAIPFIHISLTKVRSIPLTLAIIYNFLKDTLLGLVPILGDIIDFFYKSYVKNMKLIVGYVEDDREVIRIVRRKAFIMSLIIIILCIPLILLIVVLI